MTNVSKGHGFEREVKKHFTDRGIACMRGAGSKSGVRGVEHNDLIAYARDIEYIAIIFIEEGYKVKHNTSKIPLRWLASKSNPRHRRKVYFETAMSPRWTVVLMQCKISKRR